MKRWTWPLGVAAWSLACGGGSAEPPGEPPAHTLLAAAAAPVGPLPPTCHSAYWPCVPTAADVDCIGRAGDGPAYVAGPVDVITGDPYDLDHDRDGYGCELGDH